MENKKQELSESQQFLLDKLKENDFKGAIDLIKTNPSLINVTFDMHYGASSLSMAVVAGNVEAVEELIKLEADVNHRDKSKNSALGWAVIKYDATNDSGKKRDFEKIATLLIHAKPKMDGEENYGQTTMDLVNKYTPHLLNEVEEQREAPQVMPLAAKEVDKKPIKQFASKVLDELIPEDLEEVATYVNDNFLAKEYTEAFRDEVISFNGQTVFRPNHGLAHSLRVAAYLPLIIDFHKKHIAREYQSEIDEYTPEKIRILQIAALFSVVGRKDETGFSLDPVLYSKYREASANAFEVYCREKQLLNEEELAHYKTVVLEMGNTPWLEGGKGTSEKVGRKVTLDDMFLHMAHSMDLYRTSMTAGLKNLLGLFNKGLCSGEYKKELINLLRFPIEAIVATGGSLRFLIDDKGGINKIPKGFNDELFCKVSTDVKFARATLNALPLPSVEMSKDPNSAKSDDLQKAYNEKIQAITRHRNNLKVLKDIISSVTKLDANVFQSVASVVENPSELYINVKGSHEELLALRKALQEQGAVESIEYNNNDRGMNISMVPGDQLMDVDSSYQWLGEAYRKNLTELRTKSNEPAEPKAEEKVKDFKEVTPAIPGQLGKVQIQKDGSPTLVDENKRAIGERRIDLRTLAKRIKTATLELTILPDGPNLEVKGSREELLALEKALKNHKIVEHIDYNQLEVNRKMNICFILGEPFPETLYDSLREDYDRNLTELRTKPNEPAVAIAEEKVEDFNKITPKIQVQLASEEEDEINENKESATSDLLQQEIAFLTELLKDPTYQALMNRGKIAGTRIGNSFQSDVNNTLKKQAIMEIETEMEKVISKSEDLPQEAKDSPLKYMRDFITNRKTDIERSTSTLRPFFRSSVTSKPLIEGVLKKLDDFMKMAPQEQGKINFSFN